ncbi:MAG TPA: hypothetical protein VER96_25460 [Polyangiaceae bacterium]|nr:hypothetical protein [Polyangiaceae bacterium]
MQFRSPPLMLSARVVLVAMALSDCKPTAGSSCDKGEARCLDAKRELVCQAGSFIESPCNGPGGCRQTEKGTSCDFSGNKPGDPCSADDQGAASCSSKDGMLACHGGVYAFVPCRGLRGCENAEGRALCDTSIAELGDACSDENLKACAGDHSQVLICKQHTMQRFYLCRGANGCASSGGKLNCDTSIAKLGDACDKKLEGQAFACTPDENEILVCKGGAFVHDETCKSGQKCGAVGLSTKCRRPGK